MKKLIKKIIDFYHSGDIAFYVSLIGPLTMGTIHLVASIIHFDWIVVNYCIFSYLMLLFRVWQWAIEKYHIKPSHYLAGVISLSIVLAPMMAAFILTILYKDAPHYIFDWFIYAYALYGTLKMVFAIKNLCKKEKTNRQYVLSFFGLISALYTIQMMEFSLIKTFSESGNDGSMYLMQLFTQGAIFIVSLIIIVLFIIRLIKQKPAGDSTNL